MVARLEDAAKEFTHIGATARDRVGFKVGQHLDLLLIGQVFEVALSDADEGLSASIVNLIYCGSIDLLGEAKELRFVLEKNLVDLPVGNHSFAEARVLECATFDVDPGASVFSELRDELVFQISSVLGQFVDHI